MALLGGLVFTGCALPDRGGPSSPLKKVALRFCWATGEAKEAYEAKKDEAGQPLYVASEPVLTEADLRSASVWRGTRRTMILLEFQPFAAARLEQLSAQHRGDRLAVFVDDRLVMSPVVRKPLAGGKVYLDGSLTPAQAEELVARLNAAPAQSQGSSRESALIR
jgi:preprotein translocase subunit SecD